MGPGIFEFQSMMTTVVNSISGSMLSSIQTVAYTLMTICLVLGIFEAYTKGGDLRSLETTFLKYAVAAFTIGYWSNVFRTRSPDSTRSHLRLTTVLAGLT